MDGEGPVAVPRDHAGGELQAEGFAAAGIANAERAGPPAAHRTRAAAGDEAPEAANRHHDGRCHGQRVAGLPPRGSHGKTIESYQYGAEGEPEGSMVTAGEQVGRRQ